MEIVWRQDHRFVLSSEDSGAAILIGEAVVNWDFERQVICEATVSPQFDRSFGLPRYLSSISAYLRSMVYYMGILFLTTNRVGQIEDTRTSRVHLLVQYQRVDARKPSRKLLLDTQKRITMAFS